MTLKQLHSWEVTKETAIELQRELSKNIIKEDHVGQVNFIAGIDMAINESTSMGRAAVVLMTYPDLVIIEKHVYEAPLHIPYIPGLLSFREIPCMLGAFAKLKQRPDLLLVDGMGIAHPRGLGIASHLGLWLNIPTIGCGKSLLVGHYDSTQLKVQAGSWVPLIYKKQVIGTVVRTRTNVSPLFISLGHLISLQTSIDYVLLCSKGYRLPEPVRQADKLSKDNKYPLL
ncbi:deoxyribonuclease V [Candidatus Dependentiae bacterium]|nr:deoxyribonuclease V [Candidatus Dependentiae bacterium]